MTKLTYEAQISGLEEPEPDYYSVVSRWSAESIANDADNEIKTLKELLRTAVSFTKEREWFTPEIEHEINEALNND